MSIGLPEILVVVLILLLVFGGRRIPELARALGTGLRELREHVGRKSPRGEPIEEGKKPPPQAPAEPANDEEPAKRP